MRVYRHLYTILCFGTVALMAIWLGTSPHLRLIYTA